MSEQVRRTLRQVLFDLDADDNSRDSELAHISPKTALRLCCQWELGSRDWADIFLSWAQGSGYDIRERR